MAKLPAFNLYEKGPTGEVFSANIPCSVTPKTGCFEMIIPQEIHDTLKALDLRPTQNYAEVDLGSRWPSKARSTDDEAEYFIRCLHLPTLKMRVAEAAKALLSTTVTEQLVIRYTFNSTCHFWQNADDSIYPNGNSPGAVGGNDRALGDWAESNAKSGDHQDVYSVGVGATVLVKQTHTTVRGSTIKYVALSRSKDYLDKEKYQHAYRLDSFVRLRKESTGYTEIPYSDEAAAFFFDMVIGLCRAAQRMNAFFSDEDAVVQAIENKAGVMLPFKEQGPAKC
ncbi:MULTISPECIES: hypothetical protein [Serratia]|uniref:hypothetical protein n=1 Tax=Serratia TaxID=613 RepID=UPI0007451315|nr:hypothetical protein [Serratia marcescens]MCS3410965.1 hypothetical protein [Serratia marcescens]BEN25124.1 hypothetical protein SMKC032_12190 [Serratia marcescens]CUZ18501.1 Uncharacterised protein [Serratia marcescens]HEJ8080176.1 hypothetical protein [Serratia marcescens]